MNVFLKYKNGDYKILKNLMLKICVIILMM